MKFTIHDVGHGFCAHLLHDNGNVMLWDSGHKTDPEYRPSSFLPKAGIGTIHRFFVTNYDEDHISDLPNVDDRLDIQILRNNKSITRNQLETLKREGGPISPAMQRLLSMMERYTSTVTDPPSFPDVEFETFFNNYGADFTDTNNISLVTFLHCSAVNIIIPGDVETVGWQKLLEKQSFRDQLSRTHVFIASHHGRQSGYCREVFDYCKPAVVIFSDSAIKYATQEMNDTYRGHATGITFNEKTRYVLTTRQDGSLTWSA